MRSLRLIVSLGIVGFTEQVIDADAIEAGKLDEDLSWDIVCTHLIFGISRLRHT